MVDENTVANETTGESPASEAPVVRVPPIESRFLFVDVAALRAKQLRRGARVRLTGPDGELPLDLPRKAERIAMEEVRAGLVSWDLPDASKTEGEGQ